MALLSKDGAGWSISRVEGQGPAMGLKAYNLHRGSSGQCRRIGTPLSGRQTATTGREPWHMTQGENAVVTEGPAASAPPTASLLPPTPPSDSLIKDTKQKEAGLENKVCWDLEHFG